MIWRRIIRPHALYVCSIKTANAFELSFCFFSFQLETSQSKLREFHSEMDATNEWMDDTEKLLKSFSVGMDPEEASKLQEKTEVSICTD